MAGILVDFSSWPCFKILLIRLHGFRIYGTLKKMGSFWAAFFEFEKGARPKGQR